MKFTDINRQADEGELLVSAINLLQEYGFKGASTEQVFDEVKDHLKKRRNLCSSKSTTMIDKLGESITILCLTLKNDPDYRRSWKDNIAMAFQDQFRESVTNIPEGLNLHEISNLAADRFLNVLSHSIIRTKEDKCIKSKDRSVAGKRFDHAIETHFSKKNSNEQKFRSELLQAGNIVLEKASSVLDEESYGQLEHILVCLYNDSFF